MWVTWSTVSSLSAGAQCGGIALEGSGWAPAALEASGGTAGTEGSWPSLGTVRNFKWHLVTGVSPVSTPGSVPSAREYLSLFARC